MDFHNTVSFLRKVVDELTTGRNENAVNMLNEKIKEKSNIVTKLFDVEDNLVIHVPEGSVVKDVRRVGNNLYVVVSADLTKPVIERHLKVIEYGSLSPDWEMVGMLRENGKSLYFFLVND